jgi:hypothetical protein
MYKFVIYLDKAGEYRWVLFAPNNERIGHSSEGYVAKTNCRHAIYLVQAYAPGAPIDDLTIGGRIYPNQYRFEVFRDNGGEYRWIFVASNNETIAISEGYSRKDSCYYSIGLVQKYAPGASVVDQAA